MERILGKKVEVEKTYPVDIVCVTHGTIASVVPQSEAENLAVAHRENKKCFAHLDFKLRTDKPMVLIKDY